MTEPIPTAQREPTPRRSFVWILPLLALALSLTLLSQGWRGNGPTARIQAVDGHGIREGDSLRHLGIVVGAVERVRLAATLDHVELTVRFRPDAAGLAREGSRFWIVRPHLALDSISGLETIVGARYIALMPGPEGGSRRDEFVALASPPLEEVLEPGGVEILLFAPRRLGLRAGAPVEYREVRVGTVLAVGLASDASGVESRVYIQPRYAELVREGTRFWEAGGFEFDLGLTSGVHVGLESLQAMLVGAVRFATPPSAGALARTGQRFQLAERPQKEWLEWLPSVPVGAAQLTTGAVAPLVVRARLAWREGRVLKRKKERQGWLVRTDDGVLGPLDLLTVPEDALGGEAQLELEGTSLELLGLAPAVDLGHGLGRRALEVSPSEAGNSRAVRPPLDSRRALEPEDLLLLRDPGSDPMAIGAPRLASTEDEGVFELLESPGVDENWHGAVALARSDGRLVGVLRVEPKRTILAPLP